MSLDVYLMVTKPTEVYSNNITHNLNLMAAEVKLVGTTMTLYDVLWRPDEQGLTHARDISEHLDMGWNILRASPEHFKKFNPPNGWGSYEGLCSFVYQYRQACWENPDAELRISR